MSDDEGAAEAQGSRENSRFTTEIYLYLLQELGKKGFVKMAELKRIYNRETSKDKDLAYRSLKNILKEVEKRLYYFLKWKLSMNDDKICFVNTLKLPPREQKNSDENHRLNGILKAALMFIFVSKTPNSKDPDVLSDDLMQFMEILLSTNPTGKLSTEHMGYLKKLIAPNNKAHFVKKGWISFTKSTNENDEEVFRYDWGPNAKQNVDPMKLLELFQATTQYPVNSLNEQAQRAMNTKIEQIMKANAGAAASLK